jgi:hypothetical protein
MVAAEKSTAKAKERLKKLGFKPAMRAPGKHRVRLKKRVYAPPMPAAGEHPRNAIIRCGEFSG